MDILIIFATTEGQTGKIAEHARMRLAAGGHTLTLASAADADGVDPGNHDAAILAGSVHLGRYQEELVRYATAHSDALNGIRTLFLSVSLSAAGDEAEDWAELARIVERFSDQTGWTPGRVEQVAGAFRFSGYDFFRYWAMRWIEARKDPASRPGRDKEYTDWAALDACLDDWAAS